MAVPTTTTREGERSRGDLANTLAVSGLMAIFLAYLLMFSVLGGSEYASKFENGELPAGFDATGGQTAAVMSLGVAVFCFVHRHRRMHPAVASWSESSQYSGF